MTIFLVISTIFAMMVLLFGAKFAQASLKMATSAAVAGCIWFGFGIVTGVSSLTVFLGSMVLALFFIELIFGGE